MNDHDPLIQKECCRFVIKQFFVMWWHRTSFWEIGNSSLLFYLSIRLHQWLICESNEGNLKIKYASSCAFSIVECIGTSKSCAFFISSSLFCWSRRSSLCTSLLSIYFLWLNIIKKNLPWNILLTQLKVTMTNNRLNLSLIPVPYLHYTIAFQKWLIYVWFGAIQKLDSELHGTKFLVILLSNKCWNQNLKIFNTVSSYYCFDERYYFCLEARIFCENADISKI